MDKFYRENLYVLQVKKSERLFVVGIYNRLAENIYFNVLTHKFMDTDAGRFIERAINSKGMDPTNYEKLFEELNKKFGTEICRVADIHKCSRFYDVYVPERVSESQLSKIMKNINSFEIRNVKYLNKFYKNQNMTVYPEVTKEEVATLIKNCNENLAEWTYQK